LLEKWFIILFRALLFSAALGRPPAPYALAFSQERPKVPQFWFTEHQEPSHKIKAKRLCRYLKKIICKNI
jgi:hypothetical protein